MVRKGFFVEVLSLSPHLPGFFSLSVTTEAYRPMAPKGGQPGARHVEDDRWIEETYHRLQPDPWSVGPPISEDLGARPKNIARARLQQRTATPLSTGFEPQRHTSIVEGRLVQDTCRSCHSHCQPEYQAQIIFSPSCS